MMYNSALGSVVMELGRRMLLPIPGPAPFGLKRIAREITAEDAAPGWLESLKASQPRLPDRAGRFSSSSTLWMCMTLVCLLPTRFAGSGPTRFPRSRSPQRVAAGTPCEPAPPEQRGQRQRELEDVRHRLTDLYDECLSGLDAELGRFLRELRAEGRLANT